jgi:hypothetical protein
VVASIRPLCRSVDRLATLETPVLYQRGFRDIRFGMNDMENYDLNSIDVEIGRNSHFSTLNSPMLIWVLSLLLALLRQLNVFRLIRQEICFVKKSTEIQISQLFDKQVALFINKASL